MGKLKKSWVYFAFLLFFVWNPVRAMQSSVDFQQEYVKDLFDKYAAATAQNRKVSSLEDFRCQGQSDHLGVALDTLYKMGSEVLIGTRQAVGLLIVGHFERDRIQPKVVTIDFGSFSRIGLSSDQLREVIRLYMELVLAGQRSLENLHIQNINKFEERDLSVFKEEFDSFEFLRNGFNELRRLSLYESEKGVVNLSLLQKMMRIKLHLKFSSDRSIVNLEKSNPLGLQFPFQQAHQNVELIEKDPLGLGAYQCGFQPNQNIETMDGEDPLIVVGGNRQVSLDQGNTNSFCDFEIIF